VLWAVPIGFEVGAVVYNREILSRYRKRPPASMEELLETGGMLNHFGGRDTRGVAVCGLGEWSAAHSGYFTAYVNYGATDFEIEDGRLSSRVNSPEAIAVTDLWVRMLRECAPADWEEYDWRRCLGDLSDRRVAMLCDSNVIGYYADSPGASSLPGSFGVAPPPVPPGADPGGIRSNLWAWGLAINPESRRQDAAWLFVQYFTSREFQLWSVLEWKSLNPPRRSVFEDPAFQAAVASMHGYVETFSGLIENAMVYFTPNPYISDICDYWATTVRDIANGRYRDTEEGMNALKIWMDNKVSAVAIE
jgi:multiple sugar transport system substrate-binding protein